MRRRAARRKRLASAGGKSAAVRLGEDPIVRATRLDQRPLWMLPVLIVSAAGLHLLFGVSVGAIAEAFAVSDKEIIDEKIIVEINEITEPEPIVEPERVVETEPEPEPEKVVEPEPEPKPEPKPKPKPKVKKPKVVEPKPEPEPEAPPPPRRVIGLDLGSTVEGGNGPAFAGGNALDGSTASKAVDPNKVKANPGQSTEPVREPTKPGPNRRATIIPQKGVKLVKPKRKQRVKPKYPPTLKAQGIEANVVVEVEITAKGRVKSVQIISPAKEAAFNKAAKEAALKEVFSPASKNGMTIPFRLTFTYRYRISD